MKTIEYRTKDKSKWPEGPWKEEPDKKQWQDEKTGMPCLIVRNNMGGLCGYVGVGKDHSLHGLHYDDAYDKGYDIEVHGGLTYASGCNQGEEEGKGICHLPAEDEPDDIWWFGFDCAHSGDFCPYHQNAGVMKEHDGVIYRNINYVEMNCRNLAEQLSDRSLD